MHGSLQNLCYPGRVMRDDKADGVWSLLLLHAVHQTSCSVSGILTDLCHASGTCDEMPDVQSCMQAQRAPRKWPAGCVTSGSLKVATCSTLVQILHKELVTGAASAGSLSQHEV